MYIDEGNREHVSYLFSFLACTDTIGYYETGTGHTCQTYNDYGFCFDGEINDEMPPAEPIEAILNCCICGKS